MSEFLVFGIAVFGASMLVKVLVRNTFLAVKPFTCSLCMGFWFGMAAAWWLKMPHKALWGFYGAGFSYMLNWLITREN